MKKNDTMQRFLWCDKENRPTVHVIAYCGCKMKNNHMNVIFCHACLVCNTDPENITVIHSEVSLEDWTALKTRVIYDHV